METLTLRKNVNNYGTQVTLYCNGIVEITVNTHDKINTNPSRLSLFLNFTANEFILSLTKEWSFRPSPIGTRP